MRENTLGQGPRDAVARRRAARMHDAAAAVATLEPEALVELDAQLDEVADPCRRLARERRDRARTREPATGAQRVVRVEGRRIVVADGGCDPALRERARRGEERALGENQHVAVGGRTERCEEPRYPATDDEEVDVVVARGLGHLAHGSFRL